MLQVINSLSNNAKGLILTMMTGASAVATKAAKEIVETPHLEQLQQIALISTIVVASMTIISYLYKFYRWLTHCYEKCKIK